ncbi:hypothetical protein PUN28_011418 [Cardiocondyla obscurior]|uniref:Uncharacterized protein n=1 Tax=Cardiocondyla obscurior TaxID=286306 RepID=A0AAW2FG83_9HYME
MRTRTWPLFFKLNRILRKSLETKKLGKRSYSLLSEPYIRTYSSALPWYRLGGLSSYGLYGYGLYGGYGLYPSLPLSYGGLYKGW